MVGKNLAIGILTAVIGASGCCCSQKTGCSSCRTQTKPTASIVKETPVAEPASPGVAVVSAMKADKPSEPTPTPVPTASLPRETVIEAQPVVLPPSAPKSESPMASHNADYSELVGELHHNSRTGEWRLRYAGPGVEDTYGGSVTLKDANRLMAGFTSGQWARVRGALEDRDARHPSPMYTVYSLSPAQPN